MGNDVWARTWPWPWACLPLDEATDGARLGAIIRVIGLLVGGGRLNAKVVQQPVEGGNQDVRETVAVPRACARGMRACLRFVRMCTGVCICMCKCMSWGILTD